MSSYEMIVKNSDPTIVLTSKDSCCLCKRDSLQFKPTYIVSYHNVDKQSVSNLSMFVLSLPRNKFTS